MLADVNAAASMGRTGRAVPSWLGGLPAPALLDTLAVSPVAKEGALGLLSALALSELPSVVVCMIVAQVAASRPPAQRDAIVEVVCASVSVVPGLITALLFKDPGVAAVRGLPRATRAILDAVAGLEDGDSVASWQGQGRGLTRRERADVLAVVAVARHLIVLTGGLADASGAPTEGGGVDDG